MRVIKVL